jgi:hypothetical protein
MSDQEWLTIAQAATRAGVGPARIRQLIARRQVEYTRSKPGAHDTRIAAGSLAAWMGTRTRGRPPGRQATIPRQLAPQPPAPVCVCCNVELPKRRGRPRLHCTDCIIAGCSPTNGERHSH